jgi:2-ketoarginine methyltransferase
MMSVGTTRRRHLSKFNAAAVESLRLSLNHIENYVLITLMWQLLRDGHFRELLDGGDAHAMAARAGWNQSVADAVFTFLLANGVLARQGSALQLSEYGRHVADQTGWFRLFIDGYSDTLKHINPILRHGAEMSSRDETAIAIGSGEIDYHDVIPLARVLIRRWSIPVRHIVDLGAGTADVLAALCNSAPGSRGCGIVLGSADVKMARAALRKSDGRRNISIESHDIAEYTPPSNTDLIICAFVLQELAYQRGTGAVGALLKRVRETCPTAWWLVFEVPERGGGEPNLHDSYYNVYRLIHHLTKQRLLSNAEWLRLFSEAKYHVAERASPNRSVDLGGCEVCYVLRPDPSWLA